MKLWTSWRCPACGSPKEKHGGAWRCVWCDRRRARRYMAKLRKSNPKKVRKLKRESRLRNLDIYRARDKAYYIANHSRLLLEAAERRAKLGPRRLKVLRARYYLRYQENIKAKAAEYRQRVGREQLARWSKEYRATPKGRALLIRQRTERRMRLKCRKDGVDEKIEAIRSGMTVCFWCGSKIDGRDGKQCRIDHIKPLSKGGLHEASNVVPSCRNCNCSKSDDSAEEFQKRIGVLNLTFEPALG
jgi:uncharacterized Zn finger protein (UPF0148 family)